MSNDETIHRAQRAAEVLDNPLVLEALFAMRENVLKQWRTSAVGQTVEREKLYFMHCAVEEFEAHFRSLIQDGKIAEARVVQAEADAARG
jgi:hypothetical protein